jgi:hypothetical protein
VVPTVSANAGVRFSPNRCENADGSSLLSAMATSNLPSHIETTASGNNGAHTNMNTNTTVGIDESEGGGVSSGQ